MSQSIDYLVIGAGVVGLAVTKNLAEAGKEVLVIEAEDAIGTQTSSRNSEVIHAGIYYPENSLKARLCVHGKKLLYEYCKNRQVSHSKIGKIIVATNAEESAVLKKFLNQGVSNGVNDLRFLEDYEVRKMEPALHFESAIFSPSTGIIDSHNLMISFQGDAENKGAMFAFRSPFVAGEIMKEGILIKVGGEDPISILCANVINCAGLKSPNVAMNIRGFPAEFIPKPYYGKAHYYTLSGKNPFNHLIYPVNTSSTSLGVHVTLDLAGQARFGPDITWIPDIDYDFDSSRESMFYEAIRKYFPQLKDGDLQPGYTGIRPKISGPNKPAADFCIQDVKSHGVRGLINLFGIESPGLTASLAIGEYVKNLCQPKNIE